MDIKVTKNSQNILSSEKLEGTITVNLVDGDELAFFYGGEKSIVKIEKEKEGKATIIWRVISTSSSFGYVSGVATVPGSPSLYVMVNFPDGSSEYIDVPE